HTFVRATAIENKWGWSGAVRRRNFVISRSSVQVRSWAPAASKETLLRTVESSVIPVQTTLHALLLLHITFRPSNLVRVDFCIAHPRRHGRSPSEGTIHTIHPEIIRAKENA